MSIQTSQTKAILTEVVRRLYSTGRKPPLNDVLKEVSEVFGKNPAGNPFLSNTEFIDPNLVSNVDLYNDNLDRFIFDLTVLYDTCIEHTQYLAFLNEALKAHLDALALRRRRVEDKIDDYLLSIYNTDGYFHSFSDSFADIQFTDLNLTSAFVDTTTGDVLIPPIKALSKKIAVSQIGDPLIKVIDGKTGQQLAVRQIGTIENAFETTLSNLIWGFEVQVPQPTEVIATVEIPIAVGNNIFEVSKINVDPYTVTPYQLLVETTSRIGDTTNYTADFSIFGSRVVTTASKVSLISEPRAINRVKLTMRKSNYDGSQVQNGNNTYRYIFGAKEIEIIHQIYDTSAQFVSVPLFIPTELAEEMVIDAVSVTVEEDSSTGTKVEYFIAADTDGEDITDFDWRPILPVGRAGEDRRIVRFNGAEKVRLPIRKTPKEGEAQLIPLNTVHEDLSKRNPTPIYLPAADAYRICAFNDRFLPNSISLEEGVNSVRVHYVPVTSEASYDLEFWSHALANNPDSISTVYPVLDAGNDFLYGGDIGQSNVAVMAETYLVSDSNQATFLADFIKNNDDAKRWTVEVFLNGRRIGDLPIGVDRLALPWTFRQGENHIVVLANIPADRSNGSVELMVGKNLLNYGRVRLGTWAYVDIFDMRFNEAGQPKTFTIFNNEIISRRKPTSNFDLVYSVGTGKGPEAIRFRADLTRDFNNPGVSPRIGGYRVRFEFGDQ